jgi:hypothetical protein
MDEIQQAREYSAAQRAEGQAAVEGETLARIAGCTDAATLDRWITCAVTAASAQKVIAVPL